MECIGIKYCGGCSLRYDRANALKQIKDGLPGCSFEIAEEGTDYNFILVLNGCQKQCANLSRLSARIFVSVYQDTELADVIKDIKG